ncbi:MAG: IS630 family transposase [Saprospiraceae bacterium]
MQKNDARTYSNETLQYIRSQIIEFLKSKQGTQGQAAELFGVSIRFVNKIWGKYKKEGTQGIELKKRGVKKHSGGISEEQRQEIQDKINKNTPDHYGISYFLWTSEAISILIKQVTGITYGSRHVRKLLDEWGYSSQKPIYKAYEQQTANVTKWLEEDYPEIQKQANQEDAIIMWGDETGMRSDHQAGKSYSKRGKTPVIRRTGQRFSINMISAISNRGKLSFCIIDGRVNAGIFLNFLKQLIKGSQKKVILIVDGHPMHKAILVKEWVEKNKEKIELKFLPPYSPELNPDEYLNQDIKTNMLGKSRPKDKQELIKLATDFMQERKGNKKQVAKYFHAFKVKYAAA